MYDHLQHRDLHSASRASRLHVNLVMSGLGKMVRMDIRRVLDGVSWSKGVMQIGWVLRSFSGALKMQVRYMGRVETQVCSDEERAVNVVQRAGGWKKFA
jgi:hypothetical protein